MSRNALKHGATAKPNSESVATWLAIILGRPEVLHRDLTPSDDAGYRNLALAAAEARLAASENALLVFEKKAIHSKAAPPMGFDMIHQILVDNFANEYVTEREVRNVARMLYKDGIREVADASIGGRSHRLLKRYLAEARSKRRKAFAAWLEIRQRNTKIA